MLPWTAMTENPEVMFEKWSKEYGDVFSVKVGERWMVVLNGQEAIKEAVLKRGVEFAGRPDFYSRKFNYFEANSIKKDCC